MGSVNEESGFNRGALFKHGLRTMMNKMSELNEKTEFNQLIQKALLAAESVSAPGCVWLLCLYSGAVYEYSDIVPRH